MLLGVGRQGWSRVGRKQSRARAGVSELGGYGKQHWQAALGVGGLAQRDEQDEASHGEHSCLWWGTVRALPGTGMPGKPANSSWGINVLEKTLHIWVFSRLLLMLPVQETAKLGDFRGRAEIVTKCLCGCTCAQIWVYMGQKHLVCNGQSKGQARCPDWTFQLSTKDSLFRWGS